MSISLLQEAKHLSNWTKITWTHWKTKRGFSLLMSVVTKHGNWPGREKNTAFSSVFPFSVCQTSCTSLVRRSTRGLFLHDAQVQQVHKSKDSNKSLRKQTRSWPRVTDINTQTVATSVPHHTQSHILSINPHPAKQVWVNEIAVCEWNCIRPYSPLISSFTKRGIIFLQCVCGPSASLALCLSPAAAKNKDFSPSFLGQHFVLPSLCLEGELVLEGGTKIRIAREM